MPTRQSSVRSPRSARAQRGKALRQQIPRSAHAKWRVQAKGRDPVAILSETDRD
jgi:hypothetical protein